MHSTIYYKTVVVGNASVCTLCETDLGRTECQVFLCDLKQEVRVELLIVFYTEWQALESGEVCVHSDIQQVGHLILRLPFPNGQDCLQIQQLLHTATYKISNKDVGQNSQRPEETKLSII